MGLRKLSSLCLFFLVASCAAFKPAELDPKTGTFGGVQSVANSDIRTNKPMAGLNSLPFTYFRSFSTVNIVGAGDGNVALAGFLRDGLQKIGFPKLVSEEELTRFVVRSGLTSEIQNLNNVLALNRLSHYIGPFLVAEFRLHRISEDTYLFETYLMDPIKGETVFAVSRRAVFWMNFDNEILYPMLNAVKRWFDESSKLTAPERPKPLMSPEI